MNRNLGLGLKLALLSLIIYLFSLLPVFKFFSVLAFDGPALFVQNQSLLLRRKLFNTFENLRNVPSLGLRISALETENLILRSELSLLLEVEREADVLRDQLNFMESLGSEYPEMVEAKVVGEFYYPTGEYTFLLDKGSLAGVKQGGLVVLQNFLLGKVISVDSKKSKASFLLDKGFVTSCFDQTSSARPQGLCRSNLGSVLIFENLAPGEKVSLGDSVLTSGKDALYPANLILGKVVKIDGGDNDLKRTAYLEPFYRHLPETVFIREP